VGKSTFFNKVTGKRLSITEDTPGVTRDRLYADTDWNGRKFTLIDTGGLELGSADEMFLHIRKQAEIAVETCDAILFILDVRTGLSPDDDEVAAYLRKSGKPVYTVVNKMDGRTTEHYEYYNLGLGEVYPVSSQSGDGIADLLDDVAAGFPAEGDAEDGTGVLNVAVVGKPNAGKSSIVNRLLGYERTIVSDTAGTTRDAVDTLVESNGKKYNIIDTAGIRRSRSVDGDIEYYSVTRALTAIKRADVCLVVIDASEEISEQDVRICGYVHEEGKPSVIVMNKWDKVEKDGSTVNRFEEVLREKLKFMDYFQSVYISALTGKRVEKLLREAETVYAHACGRVTTGTLNDVIADAVAASEPPSHKGRRLKVYYATQVDVCPPCFILFVNDAALLHFSYKRYLENRLRQALELSGTPVRLVIRNREKEGGRGQ
jgi:GTP-binding protein